MALTYSWSLVKTRLHGRIAFEVPLGDDTLTLSAPYHQNSKSCVLHWILASWLPVPSSFRSVTEGA